MTHKLTKLSLILAVVMSGLFLAKNAAGEEPNADKVAEHAALQASVEAATKEFEAAVAAEKRAKLAADAALKKVEIANKNAENAIEPARRRTAEVETKANDAMRNSYEAAVAAAEDLMKTAKTEAEKKRLAAVARERIGAAGKLAEDAADAAVKKAKEAEDKVRDAAYAAIHEAEDQASEVFKQYYAAKDKADAAFDKLRQARAAAGLADDSKEAPEEDFVPNPFDLPFDRKKTDTAENTKLRDPFADELDTGEDPFAVPAASAKNQKPILKWVGVKSSGDVEVMRAKVPGGWLVLTYSQRNDQGRSRASGLGSSFFYPDPKHEWDGGSLK